MKEFAGGAKDALKAFKDNDHSKEAYEIKTKRCLGMLVKGSTFIDESAISEKIDIQVIFQKVLLVALYLSIFGLLLRDQLY